MTRIASRTRTVCLLLTLLPTAAMLLAQGGVRKVATLHPPSPVRAVSVCGASGLAAALGRGGAAYVWRLSSTELQTRRATEDGTHSLACSPNGKWLALGKNDGTVLIADISGAPKQTLHVGDAAILALAFSPDSSMLAVSPWEGPVELWNPASGARIARLQTTFGGSASMDFSPDSSLLATADEDTNVRIYGRGGALKATYSDLLLEPFAISFLPDGRHLVVGGADRILTILDASNARVVQTLAPHKDPIFGVAAMPDGTSVLSFDTDAATLARFTTARWNLKGGAPQNVAIDGAHVVGGGTSADHQTLVFTADNDETLTAWAIDSSSPTP